MTNSPARLASTYSSGNRPMKPAKLGQHFLANERLLRRLVEQVPSPPKRVLEIGTGDGRLTAKLLEAGYEVTSYELDRDLYDLAMGRLGKDGRLTLKLADGFTDNERYDVLVSSLPYYASRRFVEWFCGTHTPVGIVVLQKDFADKINSKPGERKYGTYSVLASSCFMMTELLVIPPYDFKPRPKVYSSALKMERLQTISGVKSSAVKLKSLFGYRGRLVVSFIRDLKKKQRWDDSVDLEIGLLHQRVEELSPSEALVVIGGMKSN
jgi:16S rRNA (adenine1518-N6/adenine1519-N6)-dimethyltransferase